MRRSILFIGMPSLLHLSHMWCNGEDDETALLQVHARLQAQPLPVSAKKHTGPKLLLDSVRQMAHRVTGENPEVVSAGFDQEHTLAENHLQRQREVISACHDSTTHGRTVVGNLQNNLATVIECREAIRVSTETQESVCTAWTNHAKDLAFPPCQLLDSSDADQIYSNAQDLRYWVADAWPIMDLMHTDCVEATRVAPEERARCSSVLDGYQEAFCQHRLSCTLISSCHIHEVEVYKTLISDSRVAMNARQDQFRSIKQAECRMNLTVDDATVNSCDDDIDVSHLVLNFEEPDHWPPCPSPQAGDPHCPAVELPEEWTNGGATELALQLEAALQQLPGESLTNVDGVDVCYPLLVNYQLSNLENSPSAPSLNTGSFSYIKAVRKSGRIMCDRNRNSENKWQTCCNSSYSSSCGASFELILNGQTIIQQPSWSRSASQCELPQTATGDVICRQPLDVVSSDNFIVTWSETRRQASLGDNEVDLVVDLFGCH